MESQPCQVLFNAPQLDFLPLQVAGRIGRAGWQGDAPRLFGLGRDVPAEKVVNLVLELVSGRYDVLSGLCVSVIDDLKELSERIEEIRKNGLYTLQLKRPD